MDYHRRSIRLRGFDYREPRFYFITICADQQRKIFGEILNGESIPNQAGAIVHKCWDDLTHHFPNVRPDAFVVMPNHAHGIIQILSPGEVPSPVCLSNRQPKREFRGTKSGSVAAVVQNLKSVSTRRIRTLSRDRSLKIWQRNYYEHIIRTEKSLNLIRLYIELNPRLWQEGIELRDVHFHSEDEIAQLLRKYRD